MSDTAKAHIGPMLKRKDMPQPPAEREPTPDPLLARPLDKPFDLNATLEQIRRDFPKTLARLAE